MLSMSIVLKPLPSDQDLLKQVEELIGRLKQEFGMVFTYSGVTIDESNTHVLIWKATLEPEMEIRLVFDDIAHVRYVSASETYDERRRWLFERLREHFEGFSIEELRDDVQHNGDMDPASYLRLALGMNNIFDELSLKLLHKGLASPHATVRGSAAEAAAMLRWPQLIDAVEMALKHETDVDIANVLALAAQLCRDAE